MNHERLEVRSKVDNVDAGFAFFSGENRVNENAEE